MPIGRIGDFGKEEEGKEQFSQSGTSSGTSVMRGPSDIDAIIANARAQSMQSAAPNVCNITLYRNGFVVGQGGFRSLRDPQNAEFVDALKNGHVPAELEEEARTQFGPEVQQIGVNLVNKSSEDFEEEEKFIAFTTEGHSLGGSVVSASFDGASPQEYAPSDALGPSGVVRVVLSDGTQHRVTVNYQTTVLQLYQHVMAISGLRDAFDLMGGFPPKALTNPSVTLKEAGLIGATVRQKV